jgi:hypothetical protein
MISFRNWLNLAEMPIDALQLHGNLAALSKPFDKSVDKIPGYEPSDIPFLTNPNRVQDLIQKWSNTKQHYELHFVSSEKAASHIEVGQVTDKWVKDNIGINVSKKPGIITIVFTNNQGLERVPLTPWIIAHRFGHVLEKAGGMTKFEKILDDSFSQVLKKVYQFGVGYERPDKLNMPSMFALHQLAAAIGVMKSASKLTKYFEFPHELLAQYLQSGKITFRPLPATLPSLSREAAKYSGVGRPLASTSPFSLMEGEEILKTASAKLEAELERILTKMVGKLFVM